MSDNFIDWEGSPTPKDESEKYISSSDPLSFKNVWALLGWIEDHAITSIIIFLFIGYIVIAATGNFWRPEDFDRYFLFSFSIFILWILKPLIINIYKFLKIFSNLIK